MSYRVPPTCNSSPSGLSVTPRETETVKIRRHESESHEHAKSGEPNHSFILHPSDYSTDSAMFVRDLPLISDLLFYSVDCDGYDRSFGLVPPPLSLVGKDHKGSV